MKICSSSGHPRCRWVCFLFWKSLWMLCSEWMPSEWESKQLIKTSTDVSWRENLRHFWPKYQSIIHNKASFSEMPLNSSWNQNLMLFIFLIHLHGFMVDHLIRFFCHYDVSTNVLCLWTDFPFCWCHLVCANVWLMLINRQIAILV